MKAVNENLHPDPLLSPAKETEVEQETIEIEEIPYSSPKFKSSGKRKIEEMPKNKNLAIITYSGPDQTLVFQENSMQQGAGEAEKEVEDLNGEVESTQEILEVPPLNQAPPESRQSTRLKGKRPIQFSSGAPVQGPPQNRIPLLRAGIDSLINDFPYPEYTDDELVNVFTRNGFSLGTDDKTRLKVIQHFRSYTKQKLTYVLQGILDKLDSSSSNSLVDLSTSVLPLRALKHK